MVGLPVLCAAVLGGLASAAATEAAASPPRKPPMGFSSWNHFGMGVTAPLLLDVADAFESTGLHEAGYVYINTDDGWNQPNRTQDGALEPCSHFTNSTMKNLTDSLHAKGFKFGIYEAAGFTTCGHRAGTLYHERADAFQFKAWGVDYLKYDDCGEANIQSYAKYFVMKDALTAAYGSSPGIDYYSYEPFQVYGKDAVAQMAWTSDVGDLWRSGGDIRAQWKSIMANTRANNKWAPNARPGHFNDADMLEIGNGQLTMAEQRSHFALWSLMKSPLIIGSDVRTLSPSQIGLLKNQPLIAINQDDLGVQGTLRVAMAADGTRAPTKPSEPHACTQNPASCQSGSKWMTRCSFGAAVKKEEPQQWKISQGKYLMQTVGSMPAVCLTRGPSPADQQAVLKPCDKSPNQVWNFGRMNSTVSQIKDPSGSSCLTFNSSSLHMEACHTEHGDKTTPNDSGCTDGNCRFSGIIYQLFYLNSLGQLTSAFTNIDNHGNQLFPMISNFPANTPWCLASAPSTAPPAPLPPPEVDSSQPLQVWAGPLSGGDVVILLLNTGNDTATIKAEWTDIGLKAGVIAKVTDVWTGKAMGALTGQISASVTSHDSAVFRLSPAV